jgi:hypothetical protein
MIKRGLCSRKRSFLLSLVSPVFVLSLSGCQPEGTGTVKGPAERPSDGALGRPFGNPPEIKKEAATPSTKEVVEPKNPKL